MRASLASLRKICFLVFFSLLGIVVGVIVFSSLKVVQVRSTVMMPELEPGEKILIRKDSALMGLMGDSQIEVGDLVLYEAPCYTTDDEGLMKIRRVTGVRGSWLRLDCDAETVSEQEILVRRDAIKGKVIFHR